MPRHACLQENCVKLFRGGPLGDEILYILCNVKLTCVRAASPRADRDLLLSMVSPGTVNVKMFDPIMRGSRGE